MRMQSACSALLALAMGWTTGTAFAQKPSAPKAKSERAAPADSQPSPAPDAARDAEDARETQILERFKSVLEKTPRRGTALDRVYGYHVERGTLDSLLNTYRDRVKKNPTDGAGWLLLGLFEAQRGRDAAAVEALREAEKTRPDDALPSYYLGQALVLVGQPDSAAEAFERALNRKPSRTDLLEIYQALGRVHQRAHRADKALAVWSRLEALFPDDLRIQEQIAAALSEEDQPAQALERYQKLSAKVTDRYRQVQLKLEAAALKVRLGKGTDALNDFENLLGNLDPDSWLAREVRRKVEDVFLRKDDLAGLAKYYESWIKKTPDDVEAMARLGRTLGQLGKGDEARSWLEKAVKLAPSRKELRTALIDSLRQKGDLQGASAQFEMLHKADPGDPDIIREWGRMLLTDTSKPEAERKKAATDVWKRLVKPDSKDPVSIAQAADLFRQANLVDDAIALYKKAIELAPDAPQYREYLGEYYHHLKRPAEALATWRETVQGPAHTAKNLGRLGEVMAGFGYRTEALEPLTEAVKLEGDDLDLRLKLADVLLALDKPLQADEELVKAEKLATDAEQEEAVLSRRIKGFQAANVLAIRAEELQKTLAGKPGDAKSWNRLALYYEANGKVAEAVQAATKATVADPKSVPAWTVLGRLQESSGNLLASAEANRMLAGLDRRARTDYLTNIAKLEARLGRRDQALKAGRDLLAAAPGNPEHDQFFAELCFGLGEQEEGLEALRRSVRANPADPKIMLTLAENLAKQFRTEEAIELFWRAFDKTTDIEAKMSVVARLTEQYLQRNQFDRLLARLEREIRDQDRQREKSLCLAQAFQSSGDFGSARAELEKLLGANTRDVQLLTQLSGLAEAEGDLATAAKYLKQAVEITPSVEGSTRLAQLYFRAGEGTEAEAIWSRLAVDNQDPSRTFSAIDSLLSHGKPETVLSLTDRLLVKSPGNWELLYREGVALMNQEKLPDASRRFQALLDQRTNDDEMSSQVKARQKSNNGPSGARMAQRSANSNFLNRGFPIQQRTYSLYQIRNATKLDNENYYNPAGNVWMPSDFGQARIAAQGWLLYVARVEKKEAEWIKSRQAILEKQSKEPRALWDAYYFAILEARGADAYKAALALLRATPGEATAQWTFLNTLSARTRDQSSRYSNQEETTQVDKTPPLPADELDLVIKSFDDLRKRRASLIDVSVVTNVATELKRAKREADSDRLYQELIKAPSTEPESVNSALQIAVERGDVEQVIRLTDRYETERMKKGQTGYNDSVASNAIARVLAKRVGDKAYPDALKLLDHQLVLIQRPDAVAARAKSKTYGNPYGSSNNRPYFSYWIGKNQQSTQIEYPAPNVYFDYGSLLILKTAYENYRKADVLSDLTAHFRKLAQNTKATEKLYASLALGYLLWWSDEKDESLRILSQAAENAPSDTELRLSLAELHASRGEPADALELADSVEPLDQKTTQRRELLALRLSVLAGDVARAQQAAERLFGLRLDSETQIQLASQMNQLGQHDLAEAVLARARRRAGGTMSTLVSLMNQYQRQGKPEPALQIAHQILRQSGGTVRTFTPYNNDNDSARSEAIQVITRSGKLKDLVERGEAQLKTSPNSAQLLQSLVDYYQALGDKEKVKATYKRLIDIRPDDTKLRFQIGLQLQRNGNAADAIEFLKVALKKDSSLFMQRYWEVQNAFQQADKMEDLMKLLDEIDLKSMRSNPWVVTNLIQNFVQNDKQREMGMKLFRKAWIDLPDSRSEMIGSFYNEAIWRTPEMYKYAREAVVPTPITIGRNPWTGVDRITAYGGGGQVYGIVDRLVEAAARQNKIEDLKAEVVEGVKKSPEWLGGKALLALLDIKAGKVEEGKTQLEALMKIEEPAMPTSARMLIGQALDTIPSLLGLEIALYEGALKSNNNSGMPDEFEYGPARRLVDLYKKAKRGKEGRDILIKHAGKDSDRYNYDPSYAAYLRINTNVTLARTFLDLGYPADAARYYADVLDDNDALLSAQQWSGNIDQFRRQAASGMQEALGGMKPEARVATLKAILTPKPDASANEPALDLVLLAYPRDMEKTGITCLYTEALKGVVKDAPALAEVRSIVEKLIKDRPNDLSVAIASALAAAGENKLDLLQSSADKILSIIAKSPLEPLSSGTRANARQRHEAQNWLGLWLVARECQKYDSTRSVGAKLADQAREAARRQPDNRWTLAILREGGQAAFDRGDRAEAERLWREMLKLVLTNPNARPAKAKASQPKAAPTVKPKPGTSSRNKPITHLVRFPAQAPAQVAVPAVRLQAARPAQATSTAQNTATSIVTIDRFDQAMQIAKLAADHDMLDFSIDAVREALATGPPVRPVAINNQNSMRVVRSGDEAQIDTVSQAVEQHLFTLEMIWRVKKASPEKVYSTLKIVVLPETRPGEVFLYSRPLNVAILQLPRSVGALLVHWAVQAGKVDELRKAIEARQSQPLATLPAKTLLTLLAIATKNEQEAKTRLQGLKEEVKKNSTGFMLEQACDAGLRGMEIPSLFTDAKSVVEEAIKPLSVSGGEQPACSLLTRLARAEFKHNDPTSAKKHLNEYETILMRATSRYSGDYSVYRRKQILLELTGEYVRAGRLEDSLEHLGRFADAPLDSRDYGEVDGSNAIASIDEMLLKLSPEERYRTLKQWILPETNRVTVRHLVTTSSLESPPAVFGKPAAAKTGFRSPSLRLIEAARDLNKLDELAGLTGSLAAKKTPGADPLNILVQLARGQSQSIMPLLTEHLNELKRTAAPVDEEAVRANRGAAMRSAELTAAELLLVQTTMNSPATQDIGEELARALIEKSHASQRPWITARLQAELAQLAARRLSATAPTSDPGLIHWSPSTFQHLWGGNTTWETIWAEAEGVVAHISGPGQESLFLRYPLTGTFEVSADVWEGGWSEGSLGFQGLIFEPSTLGGNSRLWTAGQGDQFNGSTSLTRREAYNRLTIQSSPKSVRYLANGHLFYEDKNPSRTAPWLALVATQERRTFFRNLSIKGMPVVPAEVNLVDGDHFEGWGAVFGETRPNRFQAAGESNPSEENGESNPLHWKATAGELVGRRLTELESKAAQGPSPRLLRYVRPLLDGDTLSYEFWFEPGVSEVHPTLDRVCFVLDPEKGVRLKWLEIVGNQYGENRTEETAAKLADEPANRRGSPKLALKPKSWNQVSIKLVGDRAVLSLNNEVIYERLLEPTNSRLFGFHHDAAVSAKMKSVVLRGNWPKTLPNELTTEPFARRPQPKSGNNEAVARAEIVGEFSLVNSAEDVRIRALAQAPADRFKTLVSWVLPSEGHRSFRLQGDFTTTDPAPSVAPAGDRGGQVVAPALELIKVAKQMNKLDELAKLVAAAETKTVIDQRGKLALQAAVDQARGKTKEAKAAIEALAPLQLQLGKQAPTWKCWPELIAVIACSEAADLRPGCLKLIDDTVRQADWSDWGRYVTHQRARIRLFDLAEPVRPPVGGQTRSEAWAAVTGGRSNTKGRGLGLPTWLFSDNLWTHYPSHENDQLYLKTPLVGDFELTCEVTPFDYREIRVGYGGTAVGLRYDLKSHDLFEFGREKASTPIPSPSFDKIGPWIAFRLSVKSGKYEAFVNERKIYEQKLPADPEPWIAIVGTVMNMGSVKNLKISGNPTVPEMLKLSHRPTLFGWLDDYYPDGNLNQNPIWRKSGEEIVGRKLDTKIPKGIEYDRNGNQITRNIETVSGSKLEAILKYNRPMLEDGEIAYEFFYEPDKTHVHPALDRLTFLLDPDGVKIHWLTDGAWERTGLAPDNLLVEPKNRKGSGKLKLKSGDWNKVVLKVRGDQVVLSLNGEDIYERTLETTNRRDFGLFHYLDESEARVRNVTYRGNWGKSIPAELRSNVATAGR